MTERGDYAPAQVYIADLKVVEELGAMTLAPQMSSTSMYSHTYGDQDDPPESRYQPRLRK
jgi:hypothetical protein